MCLQVKVWITFNEPWIISWKGYGSGEFAPGKSDSPGTHPYIATHNILKAHAKAYRTYETNYKAKQNGTQLGIHDQSDQLDSTFTLKGYSYSYNTFLLILVGTVGIVLNIHWAEPKNSDDASHVTASETMMQFDFGWFANPIFVDGSYPNVMVEKIGNKSAAQGLSSSRLPEFTDDEKKEIKGDNNHPVTVFKATSKSLQCEIMLHVIFVGSADFVGINFYTSSQVFPFQFRVDDVSYQSDKDADFDLDPSWPG